MSPILALIGPFSWQVHGYIYASVGLMLIATIITFAMLWKRGRLDMDEGPKFQMLQAEQEESHKGENHG